MKGAVAAGAGVSTATVLPTAGRGRSGLAVHDNATYSGGNTMRAHLGSVGLGMRRQVVQMTP
ncbi:MAG: hypothetical protein KGP10_06410 [Actinomycetales bacterium]|nr:hypothetical protein [Actinomycetales bacterium]